MSYAEEDTYVCIDSQGLSDKLTESRAGPGRVAVKVSLSLGVAAAAGHRA